MTGYSWSIHSCCLYSSLWNQTECQLKHLTSHLMLKVSPCLKRPFVIESYFPGLYENKLYCALLRSLSVNVWWYCPFNYSVQQHTELHVLPALSASLPERWSGGSWILFYNWTIVYFHECVETWCFHVRWQKGFNASESGNVCPAHQCLFY